MKNKWKCSLKKGAVDSDHFDDTNNLAYECPKCKKLICGVCVVKEVCEIEGRKKDEIP